VTSITANLRHRHVDHLTGHILYIDTASGVAIYRKPMIRRKDTEAEYQAWAAKRRAEDLSTDYATAQASMLKVGAYPVQTVCGEPAKLGRPATKSANPVAALMPFLVIPSPLPWVADIIHGSICTSAGSSNGRLNVKTRSVIGALFLSEISAGACQTSEHTLRTAQRIAKAARHAAHGIASYIERHPEIKEALGAELGADALSRAFQT
jgi:hypothetical protein